MIAINHALTGAVIGVAVSNPWLAIPMTFLSHFVCDALPHFGSDDPKWIVSHRFKLLLIADFAMCVGLVALLGLAGASNWIILSICAFVATSPDFLWLRTFMVAHSDRSVKEVHTFKIEEWLRRIQWAESPKGGIVEAVWAVTFAAILFIAL